MPRAIVLRVTWAVCLIGKIRMEQLRCWNRVWRLHSDNHQSWCCLDFLVKVSLDTEAVPKRVAQALADSSLLLLGYQLYDWDFRVIFRGLIAAKRASRRLLSMSIQLTPDQVGIRDFEEAQNYLEQYFDKANFDIYWGDTRSFTRELWEQWEG